MKISDNGISLIQRHEGCRLAAYKCPAGIWTIGYGHTSGVRQGMTITNLQATTYLRQDLKVVETCLSTAVSMPLTQNQFDALCSFVFNVGCGAFLRSTLLKKIKMNPSDPTIRDEFAKYRFAGGKVLPGLEKRRREEAAVYFS